jgi:hypothetical protein
MSHCTAQEFSSACKDLSKTIILKDTVDNRKVFIGNINHFKNCYYNNVTYKNIIDFADTIECYVRVI